MKPCRVVITGLGAITPLGGSVSELWQAAHESTCGIHPITAYDTTNMAAKLAGEVTVDLSTKLSPAQMRKMDRFTQFAHIAAAEAIADAKLTDGSCDLNQCDTIFASGIGGMSTTTREYERACERGFDRISPFYIPMTIANIAAGTIAIAHGLRGDCSCTTTACASSAHALGEGMRHIRHGYADTCVCGGTEAVVIPLAMGGFTSMQALHTGSDPNRASIPFDAERSGFVLGEGAGALVLEEYEHARMRGAHIYAELAGFAGTCDAYHMTAPDPNASGAIRAIRNCLTDANLTPHEVDYINAHGTSTPLNDKTEAFALQEVFGRDNTPPTSSTKSMTAHLLGAAGAIEAIFCALAIQDGYLPPTINYRTPDPQCALDVIPNCGRIQPIEVALSNSLGFGGHNVCLAFKKV